MSAKTVLVFCAQALFIQSALSQCTSRAAVADPGLYNSAAYGLDASYGFAAPNLGLPYGYAESPYGVPCGSSAWTLPPLEFSPTTGGALPVASSSSIPPTGISVISDNIFEGALTVAGELPFVGTAAMDGAVPTLGSGLISHACGNGVNAMVSELGAYAPGYTGAYGYGGAFAPGLNAPSHGYRSEWADRGCGCAW